MNKRIFRYIMIAPVLILFTGGCAASNPFGVGYEHSACESASNFGVCGSPLDIYKYKDKIDAVQQSYIKSGLKKKLFFAVSRKGEILVKDGRTKSWGLYSGSKWEKLINSRTGKTVKRPTSVWGAIKSKPSKAEVVKISEIGSHTNFQPVTEMSDLAVQFKRSGYAIETRTNVGDMIRDNGVVQKIWIAPYVDKKGDLVSAHEVYAVIKDPKWVIGEPYSKRVKDRSTNIPTPMSNKWLGAQAKVKNVEADTVQDFNSGRELQLAKDIAKLPKVNKTDFNTIENFLGE